MQLQGGGCDGAVKHRIMSILVTDEPIKRQLAVGLDATIDFIHILGALPTTGQHRWHTQLQATREDRAFPTGKHVRFDVMLGTLLTAIVDATVVVIGK